ncbi:MAG TPA: metallophosphoesterase family protein [Aquabacterium sp.]|nr:metallophosphoesterase family protein [Aquabacterium sp.]
MKIALFSDLHANRQATEAVWAHAQSQSIDRVVLLGDYVDYGADPAWVVDFCRDLVRQGAIAVRGNHDDALTPEATSKLAEHVLPTLQWTQGQLSAEQQAWLRSLPLTAELEDCLFAHANVHDPAHWEYLYGRMEASRSLFASHHRYVFCGHVHEPCLYHLSSTGKSGQFTPVDGAPMPLSPGRRWLAIPGSLGQPRDGNPAACYATFDTTQAVLTYFRVAYDHEMAAHAVLASGMPPAIAQALAERLINGR